MHITGYCKGCWRFSDTALQVTVCDTVSTRNNQSDEHIHKQLDLSCPKGKIILEEGAKERPKFKMDVEFFSFPRASEKGYWALLTNNITR